MHAAEDRDLNSHHPASEAIERHRENHPPGLQLMYCWPVTRRLVQSRSPYYYSEACQWNHDATSVTLEATGKEDPGHGPGFLESGAQSAAPLSLVSLGAEPRLPGDPREILGPESR